MHKKNLQPEISMSKKTIENKGICQSKAFGIGPETPMKLDENAYLQETEHLAFHQKQKQEMFHYQVKIHTEHPDIYIHFIDDKFSKVEFGFTNPYDRDEIKMLAEVDTIIRQIEERKANG